MRIKVQACGICHSDSLTKEPLARQLGASVYIDSQTQDPAAELNKLGGAKVILATVNSGEAMSAVQGGLAVTGALLVFGAAESLQVSPLLLLMGSRSVKGWYSGTAIDSQDTLAFSVQAGVRPMNETFPLDRIAEAYDRMMSGKARFRVVLMIAESRVTEFGVGRGSPTPSDVMNFLYPETRRRKGMIKPAASQ